MTQTSPSSYTPTFQWQFLHPRFWGTWLGILLAIMLAFVPFRLRDKLAAFLAKKIVKMNNRAKKRAVINLKTCFPDKTDEERQFILEQSYINAGCIFLGLASIMVRSKAYLERHTRFHNEDILTDLIERGEKIILLVPHTWPIEYPAIQLSSRGLPVVGFVKAQANPLADWLLCAQRCKYGGRLHTRSKGIKPFIRSVKEGYLGYYLPDEDHGAASSVFVPFLGAEYKATLAGLGKLAKLTKAKIVPVCPSYNRETGQYEIFISPPLSPFPTGDEWQDAIMVNQAMEAFIQQDPTQYMWLLNILRTRPDGSELY